jgi:hypothetical protein
VAGTHVGILYVAPLVSDVTLQLNFATFLRSSASLRLRRIGESIGHHGVTPT